MVATGTGIPLDRQQRLVLLRDQAGMLGRASAEDQKTAQNMAKFRESQVVRACQAARLVRHFNHLAHRGAASGRNSQGEA
ncbi:MAG: hypothetical protein ACREEL_09570 [Stellaceae bacterium]